MSNSFYCQFFNGIAIFFLIAMFIYPAVNYQSLPDSIPSHYNFWGVPDDYSSKNTIWVLPSVGLLLYVSLTLVANKLIKPLVQKSHKNEDNARLFLIQLLTITMVAFFYIVYVTVLTAKGESEGLGRYFSSIFLLSFLLLVVRFSIRQSLLKDHDN